ncbi:aldo/keto reductase [Alteromonas sp. NFXS44]|uniref:aldo/keto reductase n=1 Tax=Alteromonas sp. NFXS44 TaxID=2818435 RepID=UPI0032DF31B6
MLFKTLNSGETMPALGLGVYQVEEPRLCTRCVEIALDTGYRMFDTASAYRNEEAVGEAVRTSHVARQDIFLTTKLWISDMGYDSTLKAVETSLNNLGTDYLDLYLIHQPLNDIYGSWRAMERLHKEGVLKSIGVSNFHSDRIADLIAFNEIKPAVNQIEYNPFYQRKTELEYLKTKDIALESWAPFTEGRHNLFELPELKAIAGKYGKSVAQVVLRWQLQEGVIVIPKSVTPSRIKENFEVFDFELTADDIAQIEALDRKQSCFFSHRDPETIEFLASYK